MSCSRTDRGHGEPRGTPSKQPIAALRNLQGQSQSLNVTQERCSPGARGNKTDRLNWEDKSLSARPASIRAPAAADLKWIQHFPSHYPISLHWPAPIGTNQPTNHGPHSPRLYLKLFSSSWLFGTVHCFFLWLFVTRCLFNYTVLNHFKCFSHSTNCHMCSIAPASVCLFTVVQIADVGG